MDTKYSKLLNLLKYKSIYLKSIQSLQNNNVIILYLSKKDKIFVKSPHSLRRLQVTGNIWL